MSCEIEPLQNTFPHHRPFAWKALISVNLEDGILVQDCGRQHQKPQQVLKPTTPNNRTNVHFICVVAGLGFHVDPRSAPPPDKTKSTKTTAALGDEKPTLANQWGRGGEGGRGWGTQKSNTNAWQNTALFRTHPTLLPTNLCARTREQ